MSSELDNRTVLLADDEGDWVRAVASLIRLTEEGKLKWKSGHPPKSLRDQQVDVVFTSEYEGKRLRLHRETSKVEEPNPNLFNFGPFKRAYPYWIEEVVLELGDEAEQGWYRIPETEAARELLESVKYQVYGVDDFLSKVLDAGKSSDDVIHK